MLFHSQHTGDSQVYYLAVTGTGEETGTYSIMGVKMEDAQNWTFGPELGTRGSITVDAAPQEAEIAFEGDVDFWEFQGTADQEYIVSIRPIGTYRDRNRINPILRGIYYDDPRYQSHPGLRNNAGTTLEDFEVRGRVISGRAIFVANADGDAPFADSFSDIMHDLSRLIRFQFAASQTGTYFFGARILKGERVPTGSYEVAVTTPAPDLDSSRDGAIDLGDITGLEEPQFENYTLEGEADATDYFKFTLTKPMRITVGLKQLDANADIFLEDASGKPRGKSERSGTSSEMFTKTRLEGTYYIRVDAQETGENQYVLRYSVADPNPDKVAEEREKAAQGSS